MASTTPLPRPGRPVTRTVSILSRRKSLWKMVRSILVPSRVVAVFAACGGGRERRKRLQKYRRGQAPLERPTRAPIISTIPPPTPVEEEALPDSMQGLSLSNVENVESPRSESEGSEVFLSVGEEPVPDSPPHYHPPPPPEEIAPEEIAPAEIVTLRAKKEGHCGSSDDLDKFHGWRKSSIDVTSEPPHTLKWIPSGLQIGDQVVWLKEEQPERGVVRWIGKIRMEYYAGVEFERCIGNSSGLYGYGGGLVVRLFQCDLGFGRFIPINELVLHSDFHDKGIKAGFICIICRDDFLELPDAQGDEGHMVATSCGHLYHETCLQQWFVAKCTSRRAQQRSSGGQGEERFHPCPHCQKNITLEQIIRLFPAQV